MGGTNMSQIMPSPLQAKRGCHLLKNAREKLMIIDKH